MQRCLRYPLLLLCALALAAAAAARLGAQGVTTAAVTGQVTDEQGQPLPRAQVVVTHRATGAVTGAVTRADGRFHLPGLQPGGPYRIQVSAPGFAAQVRDDVSLSLGQTVRFDFSLAVQAVQLSGLEVRAERNPVISRGRTGTSTTIADSTLARLPTVTRDFTEIARITPQLASVSGGNSGTSAAGRNNRYNTIQIDGAVNNDVFGLADSGTPGGQASAKPISLEAIDQVQVVLAPFDVRQGGFTGAGINAVTKRGTNRLSGSASAYLRNEGFVGSYSLLGTGAAAPDVGDFDQRDLAFSLGGPIVLDRAHFFVAAELNRRSAPTELIAGSTSSVTPEEAVAVASTLRSQYGYDAGATAGLTLDREATNLFGRLDANLGAAHRLTLRHNYVDAFDDNLARRNDFYQLGNSLYRFNSTTNSTVAQLNSAFGGRLFNELRLGYTTVRDEREPGGALFPRVRVFIPGTTRQVWAGSENFSVANALDQDVLELTNDLTLPLGRHSLTLGTRSEFFAFSNLFVRNAAGYYEFQGVEQLAASNPSRYEYSYRCQPGLPGCPGEGEARAEFDARQLAFYLQDQWDATDDLRLTLGVRLDGTQFPDEPTFNPLVQDSLGVDTRRVPDSNWLLNPRIGVNWDVLGDRSTQLRGGIGLFSGRTPYVWISNAYGNTGADYVRFVCGDTATAPGFVADPAAQPASCTGSTRLSPNEINLIDPNFRSPQVLRYSFGVDQRLPFDLVATLEGLWSHAVHDVVYRETTLDQPGGAVEGRTRWTRRPRGFANVVEVTNTDRNYSYSLTAQLQRPFRDGWDFSASYTFSRSRDVNPLVSSQAFSSWQRNVITNDPNDPELRPSNYDVPHRLLLAGTYELRLLRRAPTNLSFIYAGESGRPYSYTYDGDVNNDSGRENDAVYVPTSAADAAQIRFEPLGARNTIPPEQSAANFDAFIERVECLRENRGRVLPPNACREPWRNRVDVRLAQTVPSVAGQSLQVTLDVLNLGNLLNRDWGRQEIVRNQRDQVLRVVSTTPDAGGRVLMGGFPEREVFSVDDLASRYQLQLGLRYSF